MTVGPAETSETVPPAEYLSPDTCSVMLGQAATFMDGLQGTALCDTMSLSLDPSGRPHVLFHLATANTELFNERETDEHGYTTVETDDGVIEYRLELVKIQHSLALQRGVERPTAAAALRALSGLVGEMQQPVIRIGGDGLDSVLTDKVRMGVEARGPHEPDEIIALDEFLVEHKATERFPGHYDIPLPVPSHEPGVELPYTVDYSLYTD